MEILTVVFLAMCIFERVNTVEWGNEAIRSAERTSNNVMEILDNLLGYKNLQDYYDTLSFTHRELDGNDILDKMAINFGQTFFDRNKAIELLKTIVQNSLSNTNALSECCRLDSGNLEKDDRFKQPTGSGACYRKSELTKNQFGFLSKNFEDACADNLAKMPSLRWQYFASESGITSLYPAIKVDDCGSYDGRFRPFYVQTNVPEAKDVVIVIDKSGSMGTRHEGRTLMDIAKDAAKTVISTLNPHDRVAAIGFSSDVVSMGNNPNEACFRDQLAIATAENVQAIDQFIDEISDGGSTFYGIALSKAFDYLEKSSYIDNRDRVILFLSDGIPTDNERSVFTTLKERNSKLNNSVIIMTYGLGGVDFSILRDMAAQNGSAHGVVDELHTESTKLGLFTHVYDPTNLRQEMASYYKYFAKRVSGLSRSEPIWSLPYLDAWGLGILMSVTLPVLDNAGDVIGVVGTDLTIDDLLSGAVYFRPSEQSYMFIIDSSGYVIYHPLFKYPEYNDVKYIDILAFETDQGMMEVIEDMKNGGSGSKTFSSQRVVAGGSSKLYGVRTSSMITEAHWKQILHSKFSLCVVLSKGDHESTLQQVGPRNGEEFLYHRIDLVPPQNPCKHYNNYCALNQSVVSLGPRAFSDTDAYLNSIETTNVVNALNNYMISGRGGNSIRSDIRNSVWATQEAERYWKISSDSELEKYVMWKYVGTKEGMIRIFPGAQFPKDFDSTMRPWYRNSLANRGKATFTLPYKDAVSGEYVVTLTKVIYEGSRGGIRNILEDEVVAVMGVDMMVPYFEEMMMENFPICFEKTDYRCTLIDSAGFVMYASDVNYASVVPEHITETEPLVAESLIRNNIMRHSQCIIMEETYLQRTYEIMKQRHFSGKVENDCFEYEFIPITGTNIYMVIRGAISSCGSNRGSCPCSSFVNPIGQRGCVADPQSCECPCTIVYEDYNTCINKYGFSGKEVVPKACVPEPKPLMEVGKNEKDIEHLQICNKHSVNTYSPTTPSSDAENEPNNLGIIIGCVGGFILLMIIIIILVMKRKQSRNNGRNARRSPKYDDGRGPVRTNPLPIAPPPYQESIYANAGPSQD